MNDLAPTSLLSPVPFTHVTIADSFWAPRMETNRTVSLRHQYRMCKETGRIDAFLLDWKPGEEPKPHYFWDSDVAKWVEAASYSLATHPDSELEQLLDEVVEKIVGAQQPDGYLNVYFTVVEPEMRWANLSHWHELYCAGHLIEAAVAHFQATGKRKLLGCLCRYADYIDSVFGPEPGKRPGCPGHEEIELALVKLYHVTGEERYLRLSEFFINQRGLQPSTFAQERELLEKRGHHFGGSFDTSYCQDHLPVREQSEVVGHAVRATYLYSGMADVAGETGDRKLRDACERLWRNVCLQRMYITGGIGPSRHNEGFTENYDLPNESAYAETCAAIGLIFWNHRMLQLSGEGRFADVVERALYNGALSGVSLDGTKFFYVNPLASRGGHHRQDWFGCACCPPNIARLLASLGGYLYSHSADGIWVHHYVQGSARLTTADQEVSVRQQTDYPWDGAVTLTIDLPQPATFALHLRIPGWCRGATLAVNGQGINVPAATADGYIHIEREWRSGDKVELLLPMPGERVYAHPAVREDAGLVALQRGPLVYCLEQVDNPVPLHRIALPADASFTFHHEPDLLGGVTVIEADALLIEDDGWDGALYRHEPPAAKPFHIRAIPYYAWDHRESLDSSVRGEMRVWPRSL